MKKHMWIVLLVAIVIVGLLFYSVAFIVNWHQVAIVKTFGKAGPPVTQAGLHLKWPWPVQSLVRYDTRQIVIEDTHEQITTADQHPILVTMFCSWRVKDPSMLLRKGYLNTDDVESTLRELMRDRKKRVVALHPLDQFINTDPAKMAMIAIEDEVRAATQERADEYGLEIVTIGIKNWGLPQTVTAEVIENQKAERLAEAEVYTGLGKATADTIRSRAYTARDQIQEFAKAKAKNITSEGERAAAQYYGKFQQDEGLAIFLRQLDFQREALRENSIFILDKSMEPSMSFWKDGPALPRLAPAGSTTKPAAGKVEGPSTKPAVAARPVIGE